LPAHLITVIEESVLPPLPPPDDLLHWALSALGTTTEHHRASLEAVSGDASNRRYFRLLLDGSSYILAVAPPATEKNVEFLAVRETLERAGITVPALHGADLERGYLLLGDLGQRLLLPELSEDTVDACYQSAFGVLLQLAAIDPADPTWPAYDSELLNEELGRFPEWFVQALLGHELSPGETAVWQMFAKLMVGVALEQPRVLVHRDFHSRNLMPQLDGSLGVIDFQDAVLGPVTYDLASLLRDCYIRWPASRVEDWAGSYHARLCREGLLDGVSRELFLRWFDLMGLQRHIKVLGTFARLYLRDGKQAYLADLPLVVAYVEEILAKYRDSEPEVAAFADWFGDTLGPVIRQQPWNSAG
jgi:aminoglycoside/choline kinase family phosphotransferase